MHRPLVVLAAAAAGCLASHAAAQQPPLTEPLQVTVTGPDGTPRSGAIVEVLRHPGGDAGYNNLDIEDLETARRVSRIPTARAGSVAVHLPIGVPHRVRVDAKGFAIEHRRWVYAGEELPDGATVSGEIRRQNGRPMAAVRVRLCHVESSAGTFALHRRARDIPPRAPDASRR